jgi:hypothetical protein
MSAQGPDIDVKKLMTPSRFTHAHGQRAAPGPERRVLEFQCVLLHGPRGRVVGLWPFRTGEGYFLPVHVGQLAWVRSAAAAPLASCTTLPWSSAVNLPDWRRIRPSTMTVSTLLGCASETSAS